MTIPNAAGTAATAALTGLATLHAYWALGGSWPGHDDRSLAETVVGLGAALPPTPATWAVAGLLATSAAAMASTTAGRGPRVPVLAMTWATGVALLARGGIGLPVSLAFGLDTRFGQLDALIYSPLCLALGAATILVARRSPQRHPTRGTAIVSRDTPTRPLSHGWPDNVVEQTARRSEPRKRQLRSNVPREPCPIGIGPKRAFLFHCYREAWLARHRYGPLEWLLRWATTLQRPPLRGRTGHSRTATAPPSSTELPREKDLR